jgi:site-specific DNA recombinase
MTQEAKEARRQIRCAIYTRKSSDEGLNQEFNSLDAQREAGESFIASQRAEGWTCLPTRYDDGGFSGGSLDRPAVKRLLDDIEAGHVDCVVVYKVDRLSRSLMDFARMMQTFERRRVSFVSVTQQFNTTHSMGRLTLNILLSFAQFEREIISERTRDKIAAARRKGLWGGGRPILGYDIERRPGGNRLSVNPDEAERVRTIFRTYLECGSLLRLVARLRELGWGTKSWTARDGRPRGGRPFDKCRLLSLLTNHAYLGKVRHKDDLHDGAHEAIVAEDLFAEVQRRLRGNRSADGRGASNRRGALLRGLVRCKACACAMVHHHTTARTLAGAVREYRYYVCSRAQKEGWSACTGPSVPAPELERFVVDQLREVGRDGPVAAEVVREARTRLREQADALRAAGNAGRAEAVEALLGEDDQLAGALEGFDALWDSMRLEERERLVRLLVEAIEYDGAGEKVSIAFRTDLPARGEVAA